MQYSTSMYCMCSTVLVCTVFIVFAIFTVSTVLIIFTILTVNTVGIYRAKKRKEKDLPCYNNNEIHDVPHIPKVGTRVQNKTERDYFQSRFNAENAHKI